MAKRKILILALALFSVGASAMFWPFKKYDVEMSPEVRGVIKLDGVPLSGLTVYRELFYEGYKDGKKISDEAITNAKGEFQFPEFVIRSRAPKDIFGQSFLIAQYIYTKFEEKDIYIWRVSKFAQKIPIASELMLNLNCDLTQEEMHYDLKDPKTGEKIYFPLTSICHWKGQRGHTKKELLQQANNEQLKE